MAANPPIGFDTPINKRSSFAEARGLFHLSMPDIAANEGQKEAVKTPATAGQSGQARQWTHNRKAQHRHFKAKMNLNPKLEAVRKHSSDSGTSVEDGTVITASGGHHRDPSSRFCDSGLGTPVSLLDEIAGGDGSAASSSLGQGSSTGHNSSQGSGQLSKWRSSMSGKRTLLLSSL